MTDGTMTVGDGGEMAGGWYVHMPGGNGVYKRLSQASFVAIRDSLVDRHAMILVI